MAWWSIVVVALLPRNCEVLGLIQAPYTIIITWACYSSVAKKKNMVESTSYRGTLKSSVSVIEAY